MDKNNNRVGPPLMADTEQSFFLPDLCQANAVFFLVLIAELMAVVLAIDNSGLRDFSWETFSLHSLFILWAVLSSAACLCQLRPVLSRLSVQWAAMCSFLVVFIMVLLLSALGQWLLESVLAGRADWSLDYWALADVGLISAVFSGITLRYFYLTQQLNIRQQAELRARIQALQSRIKPHFLFNSMNIISSLIAIDQEAAETAVEDLSTLFRASLGDMMTEVPFEQELDLCRCYGRIEQLRLGDKLILDWQIEKIPKEVMIPSLTLQPLLENAIYHGIQQLPEGGTVVIHARYHDQHLDMSVSNPLVKGFSPENQGNQVALENIHHRLQALYGPKAELKAQMSEQHYQAIIRFSPTISIGSS